jgi:D-beta-D-heptose 7-phosphate kinase/D-beta-D-heptose 1-phosphate adenosyltransferase
LVLARSLNYFGYGIIQERSFTKATTIFLNRRFNPLRHYLKKILSLKEAINLRNGFADKNEKLVFTNGCFDLLHPGHLRYLDRAARLGAALFVGLNSDESIKRLKGPSRPVINQTERAEMLSALEMVDGIVIFDEDTPLALIKALKPDFLVKGGDWSPKDIVGAKEVEAYGGYVLSLPFEDGFSTTALIETIAKASASGKARSSGKASDLGKSKASVKTKPADKGGASVQTKEAGKVQATEMIKR